MTLTHMETARKPTMPAKPVEPTPKTGKGRLLILPGLGAVLIVVGMALFAFPTSRPLGSTDSEEGVSALAAPAAIDGPRAYGYLKTICQLGSRPAGSAANTKQREMVAKHFQALGATLTEQPFKTIDPKSREPVAMVNLIGSWNPTRRERIVIGVHYDTRPFPDEERDPAKRNLPFIGANDGASGVALLMELAHHLNTLETPWGVDLVLFDGEELVYGKGQTYVGKFFLGSNEFARLYAEGADSKTIAYRYVAGLVLDMVGDKNLQIDQEENSVNFAPDVVRSVWGVAKKLKVTAFRNQIGQPINDDHLSLNDAGIPTIDIIDFQYPVRGNAYWHTTDDLPEHCSGESLEAVGKVVTGWLSLPKRARR